jgi:ribosomal protein S18 acetylase RimI-like enzyme
MFIRRAQTVDVPTIAAIHVETWRAAYRGQIPDAVLDGLNVECGISNWQEDLGKHASLIFVVGEEETIIGFCSLIPSRDKDADPKTTAEIAAIYIQPRHWRKGAGRALCDMTLAESRSRGYGAVTLWVLASNDPAKRFYETIGFRPDGSAKTIKIKGGTELHEVRFRITL